MPKTSSDFDFFFDRAFRDRQRSGPSLREQAGEDGHQTAAEDARNTGEHIAGDGLMQHQKRQQRHLSVSKVKFGEKHCGNIEAQLEFCGFHHPELGKIEPCVAAYKIRNVLGGHVLVVLFIEEYVEEHLIQPTIPSPIRYPKNEKIILQIPSTSETTASLAPSLSSSMIVTLL